MSNTEPGSPANIGTQLEQWRSQIEQALAAALVFETRVPTPLHEALRHAVLGGGKRYRGLLAMALAADLSVPTERLLSSAVALELIHSASLVVDDLPCMDDASRRRAAPSTHAAFGEATALLCSIALLSRAHERVAQDAGLIPIARGGIGEVMAHAVGAAGLCGGQYDDLFQDGPLGVEPLIDRYRRKTGVLFAAAFACAGIVAGCDPEVQSRLQRAGERLGVSFQLYDDLIDQLSSAETAGKDVGKDATKVTLATVLGTEAARREAEAGLALVQTEIKALSREGYASALVSAMAARAASFLS